MVLFLLGSAAYLILGLLGATDRMKENVTVFVMLRDGVADADKQTVGEWLRGVETVREAVFVPRDEAARAFIEESGDDFSGFIDFNPLPDSYEVRVRADGGRGAIADLERRALELGAVKEVVYQRAVVERMGSNLDKFKAVLLIFGGLLLVISVVLLNSTIRVSVYSKRHIIATMKLVGAESGFILRPFVRGSIAQGIWAAMIATAMFALLVMGVGEGLPEIRLAPRTVQMACIVGGMFVAGVLISTVFTMFAVNKFTRMHTNDIHFY